MAVTTSTTVDLSRLPAPIVVEQLTYEQILAGMIAKLGELLPDFDATVDSDPAVKVLQVAAYRELLIRRACQDGALQNFVAFATGASLDHLAALVGVTRQIVTPATTDTAAIYEEDDRLRQRIVLAPEGFSVAGPELAYVKHAKDASADVLDASATSAEPGEVLVSVLARTDAGIASEALLDAVRAIVTSKSVRPIGDEVTVASATLVAYEIHASLPTFAGPDAGLIVDAARTALAAYLADNRFLGRNITRAGIIAALKVPGVQDVILTSPLANIVCGPTEAASATVIDIVHGGYDD